MIFRRALLWLSLCGFVFGPVCFAQSSVEPAEAVLERLMPRIRRLERLRFGSLSGRASVRQHEQIIAAAHNAKDLVKENWLSLGALIDRSFE